MTLIRLASLQKSSIAFRYLTSFCVSVLKNNPDLMESKIQFEGIYLLGVPVNVSFDDESIDFALATFESKSSNMVGLVIFKKADYRNTEAAILKASSLAFSETNFTLEDQVNLSAYDEKTQDAMKRLLQRPL